MKKTLQIARNEVTTLFYSPIAWAMLTFFLVSASAEYIKSVDRLVGYFERGGWYLQVAKNLTETATSKPLWGFFWPMIKGLYMIFPLVTMGLISRETSSGTIKLLYSSPVRTRQIVFGKYLAILFFTLCIFLLIIGMLTALCFSIDNPDYIQLLSSMIGIFLILATYGAIGLFISSLTSYQIVAAIITIGVLALLSQIGDLWQEVKMLRDITFYLNLPGKTYNLQRGLINLRDVTYMLLFIGAFLSFTIIRLRSATESITKMKKAMRYATVIVVAVVIGFITNQPAVNLYWDATRNQVHTITAPTQAIVRKMNEGPLEITVFANMLDRGFGKGAFHPASENDLINDQWEPYIRFKPDIKFNFIYYYDTDTTSFVYKTSTDKSLSAIAKKQADAMRLDLSEFLPPEEISKIMDVKKERLRCFFRLKYKDRTSIVRVFDDNDFWPSEDEIAASLNRLVAPSPMILFMQGDIERGPFSDMETDYMTITSDVPNREALLNKGYNFDTSSVISQEIPDTIAGLVIADPRKPIPPDRLDKISRYLDKGGNMLLTVEPDRAEVAAPLLGKLGLTMRKGSILEARYPVAADMIFAELTDTAKALAPQFAFRLKNDLRYFGDSAFRVGMHGAAVMEYRAKDGFRIDPLLITNGSTSWNRLTPIDPDSLRLKPIRHAEDEPGPFVTSVRLERMVNGKLQRIFVSSDADYLIKTNFYGNNPRRYNPAFGFWCFSQFSYGKFPSNTVRTHGIDNSFRIKSKNIPFQKLIFYWILPVLIVIAGSVLLLRRKRK